MLPVKVEVPLDQGETNLNELSKQSCHTVTSLVNIADFALECLYSETIRDVLNLNLSLEFVN